MASGMPRTRVSRIAPPARQRFDSLTDSLTNGRPWTWWTPLDSNLLNFNGKDAAGRMRTGVCTTEGQGVAGSNPVIPTNNCHNNKQLRPSRKWTTVCVLVCGARWQSFEAPRTRVSGKPRSESSCQRSWRTKEYLP